MNEAIKFTEIVQEWKFKFFSGKTCHYSRNFTLILDLISLLTHTSPYSEAAPYCWQKFTGKNEWSTCRLILCVLQILIMAIRARWKWKVGDGIVTVLTQPHLHLIFNEKCVWSELHDMRNVCYPHTHTFDSERIENSFFISRNLSLICSIRYFADLKFIFLENQYENVMQQILGRQCNMSIYISGIVLLVPKPMP